MKQFITYLFFLCCIIFCNKAQAELPKTISAATIYEVLTVLPIYKDDRDDPRKQDQLYTVAVSIERAIPQVKWPENYKVDLVAYLVTIGYHESRYSLRIHNGVKKAHSYGLWQVTPFAHKVKREQLIGLSQSETDSAALIAAKAVSISWNCGSSPADHFTAYYGGVPCKTNWRTLQERVRTYWYVRAMIVQFEMDRNR